MSKKPKAAAVEFGILEIQAIYRHVTGTKPKNVKEKKGFRRIQNAIEDHEWYEKTKDGMRIGVGYCPKCKQVHPLPKPPKDNEEADEKNPHCLAGCTVDVQKNGKIEKEPHPLILSNLGMRLFIKFKDKSKSFYWDQKKGDLPNANRAEEDKIEKLSEQMDSHGDFLKLTAEWRCVDDEDKEEETEDATTDGSNPAAGAGKEDVPA